MVTQDKGEIRKRLLAERRGLSPEQVGDWSRQLIARLETLPVLCKAHAVGLYWPLHSAREVDLRVLDVALRARGVSLFYPSTAGDATSPFGFRKVSQVDELIKRGQGFAEPSGSARLAQRDELDLVLVPAVGATAGGHRMGFGSGFYDRVLPLLGGSVCRVIVVFHQQMVRALPLEAHDVVCDGVVTERRLYDSSGRVSGAPI